MRALHLSFEEKLQHQKPDRQASPPRPINSDIFSALPHPWGDSADIPMHTSAIVCSGPIDNSFTLTLELLALQNTHNVPKQIWSTCQLEQRSFACSVRSTKSSDWNAKLCNGLPFIREFGLYNNKILDYDVASIARAGSWAVFHAAQHLVWDFFSRAWQLQKAGNQKAGNMNQATTWLCFWSHTRRLWIKIRLGKCHVDMRPLNCGYVHYVSWRWLHWRAQTHDRIIMCVWDITGV